MPSTDPAAGALSVADLAELRPGWEAIACPVCTGERFQHLFEKRGELFVRCFSCGLSLINPRPSPEVVGSTYDDAYSGSYIAKADKKVKRCRRWVARLRRRYPAGARWLDVGCSAGFVVKAAAEAGFDAWGVEIEPAAVRFANTELGLEHVTCGTLEAQAYPESWFDVISLYDVIEHVPDLNALVAELRRILRPGGTIEIRTPDQGHWSVPKQMQDWKEVKPSEHLYYFDRATLVRLFGCHGLAASRVRLMFKPALDVFFGLEEGAPAGAAART